MSALLLDMLAKMDVDSSKTAVTEMVVIRAHPPLHLNSPFQAHHTPLRSPLSSCSYVPKFEFGAARGHDERGGRNMDDGRIEGMEMGEMVRVRMRHGSIRRTRYQIL